MCLIFEKMIKIVKGCLHKCLHHRKISERELITILSEIEAVVNNRPITYVTSDINDGEALTPSHLLYGRQLRLYPNVVTVDRIFDPVNHLEILHAYHNKLSKCIVKFTNMWETEYLQSLRERHLSMSKINIREPILNEVVIVKNKEHNRKRWNLGRIMKLVLIPFIWSKVWEDMMKLNFFLKNLSMSKSSQTLHSFETVTVRHIENESVIERHSNSSS